MTQPDITSELDALLARTLRPNALTSEQRQRHLRQLGLVAPKDAALGTGSMPSVQRTVRVPDGGQPVDNSPSRRALGRQWLELAAAVIAIAAVGGLLALVFRGTDGDPESQPGSAATPTIDASRPDMTDFAFISNVDGNDDIYLYDASEEVIRRLTNDPASDRSPVWSPDGTRIAFSRGPEDDRVIYVMDADGSDQRNITGMPGDETNPAWSPDGRSLVFTNRQDSPVFDSEVYVVGLDGSAPRNLTNDPESMDQSGPWSQDGSRILYSRTGPDGMELAVMETDGSDKRTLATGGTAIFPGNWSPDGSLIGFSRLNDFWQGYVMNADGSNERLLIEGLSSHGPSWSPDGSQMVVVGRERDDLFLLDGDGTNPRPVEPPNGAIDPPTYRGFMWTSDSVWLYALIASADTSTSDLVALAADGSSWTLVETSVSLPVSTEGVTRRPQPTTDDPPERTDELDGPDDHDADDGDQQALLFVASHVAIDRGLSVGTLGRVRV